MTRAEHIRWCKKRALEYVGQGDLSQAIASMLSDLGKHDETAPMLTWAAPMAADALKNGRTGDVRHFINGFAE